MARTIGVDTGGTFTDLVAVEDGKLEVHKLSSSPADPSRAVLSGLEHLGGAGRGDHVVHGTTVALNALLTGNVARVALIADHGMADLIEIGRQDRADIYALEPTRGEPLVPRRLRLELDARAWPENGALVQVRTPTREDLEALRAKLARLGAESVAVCLLHSYADPTTEARVAAALEPLGLPITTSAGILPEHREYERFSTAVVNAALVPRMRAYLGQLGSALGSARLSILQSSGGTLRAERAAVEPVRVILSGPAGGVVGAARAAEEAGFDEFVTLDMGGTSTDVAFHRVRSSAFEAARATDPVRVAGHPIGVPTLDIHTIGCGGGSLVQQDAGGVLHVGPESAGADPGPVCYGKSEVPTVTDAHVQLGHVRPGAFVGGLELDVARVNTAFERLGKALGLPADEAAHGVLELARAAMRRAIGVMTMQRGKDPAALPLIAFGGAGGLHAAALVESLGLKAALIPRDPGALSAHGMVAAEEIVDSAHSVLQALDEWPRKRRTKALRELEREALALLRAGGTPRSAVRLVPSADLRYRGQSFELCLPESDDLEGAFARAHERLYGTSFPYPIELVCLRLRALVPRPARRRRSVRARALPAGAVRAERPAIFDASARPRRTRVIDRHALAPGHRFEGPALVEEYSGTTVVPPGWGARVTPGGHLLLERPRTRRGTRIRHA